MPAGAVHLAIPTHTTRHLACTLAGIARQTHSPATVIVTCDGDDPAIGDVIAAWAPRLPCGAWWLRRPHTGGERLCQIRNNAVRHLTDSLGIGTGRLLILDGDMVLHPDAVARHAALGARFDLVYPSRINLDQPATAALDPEAIAGGAVLTAPTAHERHALTARDGRYLRHLLLRRLRIGPLHKPKLLGGHFSCDLALYARLNGFDECYQGWGFKDDEFAYRAARLRASVKPACAAIPAWHLWHPTRQPDAPMRTLPTAARFALRKSLPLVCEHGIRHPLPQPDLAATHFPGAGAPGP